jgi:hypothetical protein
MDKYKIFERIINGNLRPNLRRFGTKAGLKALEQEFYSFTIGKNDILESGNISIPQNILGLHSRDGDDFKLILKANKKGIPTGKLVFVKNEGENDLINIDIPPPPDQKSEIFLRIIEDEYKRLTNSYLTILKQRAPNLELQILVKKQVQILKDFGKKAHLLRKMLNSPKSSKWETPNGFIIETVKYYILRLIEDLQVYFYPLFDIKQETLLQLEDELFEGRGTTRLLQGKQFSINLNQRFLEKMYEGLGVGPTLAVKKVCLINKIKSLDEAISNEIKKDGYSSEWNIDSRNFYLKELGNILNQIYYAELMEKSESMGLIEKYENTIQNVTELKIKPESIEYKALATSLFFETIEAQLNAWRDLIKVSYFAPVKENFFEDLLFTLITIQTRKHLNLQEDQWNDYITDLLRCQKYSVSDQSRAGTSGNLTQKKKQSGELDICIREPDKKGTIRYIIETVKVSSCGKNNKVIKDHIFKLLKRYDTAGNNTNYFVVFATANNFYNFWDNYCMYINQIDFWEEKSSIQEVQTKHPKTDLKIGLTEIKRGTAAIRLYHFVLNMAISDFKE